MVCDGHVTIGGCHSAGQNPVSITGLRQLLAGANDLCPCRGIAGGLGVDRIRILPMVHAGSSQSGASSGPLLIWARGAGGASVACRRGDRCRARHRCDRASRLVGSTVCDGHSLAAVAAGVSRHFPGVSSDLQLHEPGGWAG